jgi:hypothetical protein
MPGMYLQNSSCHSCPPGMTSYYYSSSSCSKCPASRYSPGNQYMTCDLCPIGKYSDSDGQSKCSDCPYGKFSNRSGLTGCGSCPSSQWTARTGCTAASDCTTCDQGYVPSNSSRCSACPQGKFQKNSACVMCSPGFYAALTGVTFCEQCPYGTWNNEIASITPEACRKCPPSGATCDVGSTVPFVFEGWFRSLAEGADNILQCIPFEACPQGGLNSTICLEGYAGRACSSCSQEFFRLGTRCRRCLPLWARILLVTLAVLVVFVICWKLTLVQDRIPITLKIAFYWIQFIGLYGQLSDKWPSSLKSLFNFSNFFNFEIQYFGLSCGARLSFWTLWIVKMMMPIMLAIVLLCCFFLRLRVWDPSISCVETFSKSWINIAYTLTMLSTLIFSNLFQVFNCVDQGRGYTVLLADPSVKCFDSEWKMFSGVALVFILMYIALPFCSVICHYLKFRNDRSLIAQHLGVFSTSFREGCEYWEFYRLLHKMVFVIIRDAASLDRATKTVVLLIVLGLQQYIESRLFPYQNKSAGHTSIG